MIKNILYALGWLWLLPVNLLALCWLLPMKWKGTFESVRWDWEKWCWHWDVSNDSKFSEDSMKGWWGFVIGNNIVYIDYFPETTLDKRHIKHEETHVLQNYIFGMLFYPAYLLCSGCIYFFQLEKNSYVDNPFEIWARKKAGQRIYIPEKDWPQGPNDHWPWW